MPTTRELPEIPGILVYEALPPGFDGGTDEKDHLVRWVGATSMGEVKQWMDGQGLACDMIVVAPELSIHDAGVDAVIYGYADEHYNTLQKIREDGRHWETPTEKAKT